jgi:4-hydroxybenzoate polyprenyltransferase
MICYAATLAVLAGIGTHYGMGPLYYGGLAVAGALMLHHYRLVRTRDRDACFKAFNQNNWVGAVVFAGIFADFATKGLYPWISV